MSLDELVRGDDKTVEEDEDALHYTCVFCCDINPDKAQAFCGRMVAVILEDGTEAEHTPCAECLEGKLKAGGLCPVFPVLCHEEQE